MSVDSRQRNPSINKFNARRTRIVAKGSDPPSESYCHVRTFLTNRFPGIQSQEPESSGCWSKCHLLSCYEIHILCGWSTSKIFFLWCAPNWPSSIESKPGDAGNCCFDANMCFYSSLYSLSAPDVKACRNLPLFLHVCHVCGFTWKHDQHSKSVLGACLAQLAKHLRTSVDPNKPIMHRGISTWYGWNAQNHLPGSP